MTFYEAALRVLESAGRPLHVDDITQQSVQQNLLSHVGKTPEQTMLSRLSAMARRPRDRRVIVTGKDTFALTDWQLPEDTAALAQMAVPEVNPEEGQPPYRPVERHPESRSENVRAAGRGADRKRREDREERKKRRFPPIPEVVFEILSESDSPLKPSEIAERARARELAGEELSDTRLLTALLEDNQRRIDAGRRPQFTLEKETGAVALERAGAPSEAPSVELQAAFAAALGIPLEGGRPVLPRRGPELADAEGDALAATQLRQTVKDARRTMARAVRRRLGDLEGGTFEKSCVRMLQALGFRELKVAKRGKEGPLLTSRKREGSVELRYAIRMQRGMPQVERRMVQDLRRDLGHYSAQVGLLLTAGEVRGDARGEATASGALVFLWCGDALGDKFLEAGAGVRVEHLELYELDERFFEEARVDAIESLRRREERHRERQGQEGGPPAAEAPLAEGGAPGPSAEASLSAPVADVPGAAHDAPLPADEAGGDEDGDEGDAFGDDEELEAASAYAQTGPVAPGAGGGAPGQPGQPGQGRKRRRRRRGRRGRGPRPEGSAPGPGSAPGAPAAEASGPPPAAPPPPSSPSPEGGGTPA